MNAYIILIRGINVGGKNKLSMIALKECLEKIGFTDVVTYIASGNVILRSNEPAKNVQSLVENTLPKLFKLDNELIKVLVLTYTELQDVFDNKPIGFGEQPLKYRSDAIFLMDINITDAMAVVKTREGVDKVWAGSGVIYFQRLDALRTKSRLSGIVGTPAYKSMTIRSWSTVTKLLSLLENY